MIKKQNIEKLKYANNNYMKSNPNISRNSSYVTLKKRLLSCHSVCSLSHQEKRAKTVKENIKGKNQREIK